MGFDPTDIDGLMQRMRTSQMRARPELQAAFDYSQLEEKYPVRSVAARYQLEQQREREQPFLEEDLEYKKTLLEDRVTELSLKKTARDLDLYESRINREDAMLEQVPLARQELGQLDPRDSEYLSKRMDIVNKYPVAFEYEPFLETVDKPMLFRHSRLKEARVESGKEITEDAFQKSAMLLGDKMFQKRIQEQDPIAILQGNVARDTVNRFMMQRGMSGATQPTPAPAQEMSETPEVMEFGSEEEAMAYGLPSGTIVYINGRKARID